MKWKEVYSKCNTEPNSVITELQQPIQIKSVANNFFKKYKWIIIIVSIMFIIAFATTLSGNIKLILISIVLLILLLIAMIYYNTYVIKISDNKVNIDISFKQYSIKIDKLVNIYLKRKRSFVFLIIPHYYYFLNIRFFEGEELKEFTLSTLMATPEDVKKAFDKLEFKTIE